MARIDRLIQRSQELRERGRDAEAIELLREVARAFPEDGRGFEFLGSALWETGQREESVRAWYEAVRLHSELECPRAILAIDLRELGRFEEALEVLEQGLTECPRSRTLWLCEMAAVHEYARQLERAIALYDEVLATEPGDGRAQRAREEAARGGADRTTRNSTAPTRTAGRAPRSVPL